MSLQTKRGNLSEEREYSARFTSSKGESRILSSSSKNMDGGEMERALVMHSKDNVATAISEFKREEVVSVLIGSERREVKLVDDIPFCHKLAIKHIDKGAAEDLYQELIDVANGKMTRSEVLGDVEIAINRWKDYSIW